MMKFQLFARGTHIEARVEGIVSAQAWETMLTQLHRELEAHNHDRLLLDLFGLLGFLAEADRRAVGALMAAQLVSMRKVAAAIHAHKITGVVQAEAQRLGLDLQLFPDRQQAIDWLLS
jgi:hypothetical protein